MTSQQRVGGRPVGGDDLVVKADVLLDAGLARRVLDVLQDRRAVGDRLLAVPGTERVAEREHVGVGTNARVPEQVPRAADRLTRFEDRVVGPRAVLLQVVRRRRCRKGRRRRRERRDAPSSLGGRAGELVVERAVHAEQLFAPRVDETGVVGLRSDGSRDGCSPSAGSTASASAAATCAASASSCATRRGLYVGWSSSSDTTTCTPMPSGKP